MFTCLRWVFPLLPGVAINKKHRKCPYCNNKGAAIEELFEGARCAYCGKIVEVNAFYSYGVSLILSTASVFLFKTGITFLAWVSLALLIFFTSSYKFLITHYLPLKSYKQ